jgi:hypothetical protein
MRDLYDCLWLIVAALTFVLLTAGAALLGHLLWERDLNRRLKIIEERQRK